MVALSRSLRCTFAGRLAVIAVLGLGLRVGYIFAVERGEPLSGDATYYHEGAKLLADGQGIIDPYRYLWGAVEEVVLADGTATTVITPLGHREPTAGHPPMYLLYLGTVSALGLRSVLAHQLASALLGTASVVLAGVLGRRLVNDLVGLIAAGLTAGYAFIWINDGLVMSETAAIVAVLATSLAALAFWEAPSWRRALLFGAVGGLAALTRAELVLFTPLVAAVGLWRAPLEWRRRLSRCALVGAGGLVVVAPWVVRNLIAFERPVLLSNGLGTVLVQANCDSTYYGRHIGYWDLACGLPQPYGPAGELLDESERDAVVRDRALRYMSDHKRRLATVVVPARIGRMWGLYQPIEQLRLDVLVEERSFRLSVLGYAQFLILAPSALVGGMVLWRGRRPVLPIAAWALVVTVTAAVAFGNTRYRTAAEVTIVVLAAVAFEAGWQRWTRR